jgi:5-hydroxyisourate hydrolase
MSPITSHVLDTALGRPASGVTVLLHVLEGEVWRKLGQGSTDAAGRVKELFDGPLEQRTYRLTFETGAYYARQGSPQFYPVIEVQFSIEAVAEHYHIPVLLSPFGYSTYRGS